MKKKTTNKVLRKFTDERGELFTMLFFYLIFYGSLIFFTYFLVAQQPLFILTFVTAIIGAISSMLFFSQRLAVPFSGSEPFELNKRDRKVISFLKGGIGKKNVTTVAVGTSFIITVFGLLTPRKSISDPYFEGFAFTCPSFYSGSMSPPRLGSWP